MPLIPVAPPQPVAIYSSFDYMTADAERRRIYAAHTLNRSILIVNADNGIVLGQVRVGAMHGVAVNPENGHVYTGQSDPHTVTEVDPVAMKVVSTVKVDGPIDAMAYDSAEHHIYADEDGGTRVFVIDSRTMKVAGTIPLPPDGGPESLAVDPNTHKLYQNLSDLGEFVIIDPNTLQIEKTIKTPELTKDHPLQIDAALHHVYVGGENGVLSTYDLDGTLLSQTKFTGNVDQCELDWRRHNLGCAGNGGLTIFHDAGAGGVSVVATQTINPGVHTVAADPATGTFWVVWGVRTGLGGAMVQGFRLQP